MTRFHDFALDEAREIAARNDPGPNVPSVSRTLLAEIDRLQSAHDAMESRLREAERDARRYRWLRDLSGLAHDATPTIYDRRVPFAAAEIIDGDELDAAIDRAMEGEDG